MERGDDHPLAKDDTSSTRRRFLSGVGVGALGALLGDEAKGIGMRSREVIGTQSSTDLREFYLREGLTYLASATSGLCPRRIVEIVAEASRRLETEPVSMAFSGGEIIRAAEAARASVAALIGCETRDVVLTHSTTDGLNAVADGIRWRHGDRIVTTDQEHPGGLSGFEYARRRYGIEIDVVEIGTGDPGPDVIVDRFASKIGERTRAIVFSHVLTSTGLALPAARLAKLARERGVLALIDGAQAAGSIVVDVRAIGCHAYASSGHKWLMGPKGTGFLYLAPDASESIDSIRWRSGRSFYSASTGVDAMPSFIGLAAAVDAAVEQGIDVIERRNRSTARRLVERIGDLVGCGIAGASSGAASSPIVTIVLPPTVDAERESERLRARHGIIVKVVPRGWLNGLRVSPHRFNETSDIDRLIAALIPSLR